MHGPWKYTIVLKHFGTETRIEWGTIYVLIRHSVVNVSVVIVTVNDAAEAAACRQLIKNCNCTIYWVFMREGGRVGGLCHLIAMKNETPILACLRGLWHIEAPAKVKRTVKLVVNMHTQGFNYYLHPRPRLHLHAAQDCSRHRPALWQSRPNAPGTFFLINE